jgi:hypothetical protein
MSFLNSPRAKSALLLGALIFGSNLLGCGSGNPNEDESLRTVSPGEPLKEETVSERRSRTRNVSKQLAKIEAKNAEATKKLEEAKKKNQ